MSTDPISSSQARTPWYIGLFSRLQGDHDRVYTAALQKEQRQIRLMTLLPGKQGETIQVTLSVVSLDTKPKYEALSYVWGDPKVTKSIRVNEQLFQVTTNLEAALRHLRGSQKERIIWVDAVCVNQRDLEERGFQVSLMADLYRGCTLCTVWLGEGTQNADNAMNLLQAIAMDGFVETYFCPFHPELRASHRAKGQSKEQFEELTQAIDGRFQPLGPFFKRPWWSRTWTVQELILPKTVVLRCGRREIGWDRVLKAFRHSSNHWKYCPLFSRSLGENDNAAYRTFSMVTSKLYGARNQYFSGTILFDMLELLSCHRGREASDSRDKVIGFLSLCPTAIQEKHEPDYHADVMNWYSWPTVSHIEQWGNLEALGIGLHLETETPSLSSWVPDWSRWHPKFDAQELRMRKLYSYFNAAASTTALFLQNKSTLSLWGIQNDTILATGDFTRWIDDQAVAIMSSWLALWGDFYSQTSPSNENSASSIVPFLRTILRDTFQKRIEEPKTAFPKRVDQMSTQYVAINRRALPENLDAAKRWWTMAVEKNTFLVHLEMEKGPDAELLDKVSSQIHLTTSWSRFFITESHRIGLGPTPTRVGDQIWIMTGGKTPLVLRPMGDHSLSSEVLNPELRYKLVGDCYLDGIMDGEVAGNLERDMVEVKID